MRGRYGEREGPGEDLDGLAVRADRLVGLALLGVQVAEGELLFGLCTSLCGRVVARVRRRLLGRLHRQYDRDPLAGGQVPEPVAVIGQRVKDQLGQVARQANVVAVQVCGRRLRGRRVLFATDLAELGVPQVGRFALGAGRGRLDLLVHRRSVAVGTVGRQGGGFLRRVEAGGIGPLQCDVEQRTDAFQVGAVGWRRRRIDPDGRVRVRVQVRGIQIIDPTAYGIAPETRMIEAGPHVRIVPPGPNRVHVDRVDKDLTTRLEVAGPDGRAGLCEGVRQESPHHFDVLVYGRSVRPSVLGQGRGGEADE